jgi:hypothetical protein
MPSFVWCSFQCSYLFMPMTEMKSQVIKFMEQQNPNKYHSSDYILVWIMNIL